MKITFFVGEFNGGGAERVISILANKLVERDFDIEILKYHNTENLYETNPRIVINSVEENTNTRKLLTNIVWLKKHFKENTDIIISFLAPFNIIALLANTGNNAPIIVADRNDPRRVPSNPIIRFIRNLLYRFADGIVLQTKDNKEYFSKAIQRKSVVISNPIDLKEKASIALKTLKQNTIVTVARLEEQKNQKMLIRSFYELKDEFNDYQLVIYGEGSYRNELQSLIDELEMSDRISLPGHKEDVIDRIASSKLFVLCSNYEGMSNSLIEAMCLGLPVICTKVSGTNELIVNNENGLLININNQKELTESIRKLLIDNELSSKLATNASKLNDELNSDVICDKWIEFINSIKK